MKYSQLGKRILMQIICINRVVLLSSLGQMEKDTGCRILDHQLIVRGLCHNCSVGEKDESEK